MAMLSLSLFAQKVVKGMGNASSQLTPVKQPNEWRDEQRDDSPSRQARGSQEEKRRKKRKKESIAINGDGAVNAGVVQERLETQLGGRVETVQESGKKKEKPRARKTGNTSGMRPSLDKEGGSTVNGGTSQRMRRQCAAEDGVEVAPSQASVSVATQSLPPQSSWKTISNHIASTSANNTTFPTPFSSVPIQDPPSQQSKSKLQKRKRQSEVVMGDDEGAIRAKPRPKENKTFSPVEAAATSVMNINGGSLTAGNSGQEATERLKTMQDKSKSLKGRKPKALTTARDDTGNPFQVVDEGDELAKPNLESNGKLRSTNGKKSRSAADVVSPPRTANDDEEESAGSPAPSSKSTSKRQRVNGKKARRVEHLPEEMEASSVSADEVAKQSTSKSKARPRSDKSEEPNHSETVHEESASASDQADEGAEQPESESGNAEPIRSAESGSPALRRRSSTSRAFDTGDLAELERSDPASQSTKPKSGVRNMPRTAKSASAELKFDLPDCLDDGPSQGAFIEEEKMLTDALFERIRKREGKSEFEMRVAIEDWTHLKDFKYELEKALPNRTKAAVRKFCKRRYRSTNGRGAFTPEEDKQLLESFARFPHQWTQIADFLDRAADECKKRYDNVLQYGASLKSGPWSQAEEDQLVAAVRECVDMIEAQRNADGSDEDHNPEDLVDWRTVSSKLGSTRGHKRCKEKWAKLRSRSIANFTDGKPFMSFDATPRKPPTHDTEGKKWRALAKRIDSFLDGDFYDLLTEIHTTFDDRSQRWRDESTIWAMIAKKNNATESKFTAEGLRRAAYNKALMKYGDAFVGVRGKRKEMTIANNAFTIAKRIKAKAGHDEMKRAFEPRKWREASSSQRSTQSISVVGDSDSQSETARAATLADEMTSPGDVTSPDDTVVGAADNDAALSLKNQDAEPRDDVASRPEEEVESDEVLQVEGGSKPQAQSNGEPSAHSSTSTSSSSDEDEQEEDLIPHIKVEGDNYGDDKEQILYGHEEEEIPETQRSQFIKREVVDDGLGMKEQEKDESSSSFEEGSSSSDVSSSLDDEESSSA